VHEHRERLVREIRTAERAQELLVGLERRLKERDASDLEEHLGAPGAAGRSPAGEPPGKAVGRVRRQVRQGSRRWLRRFGGEQVPLEERGKALDAP
jgi:hypothetical protein